MDALPGSVSAKGVCFCIDIDKMSVWALGVEMVSVNV